MATIESLRKQVAAMRELIQPRETQLPVRILSEDGKRLIYEYPRGVERLNLPVKVYIGDPRDEGTEP